MHVWRCGLVRVEADGAVRGLATYNRLALVAARMVPAAVYSTQLQQKVLLEFCYVFHSRFRKVSVR